MKVLLIGNLAEDRQESMQRFTALLRAGLAARGHAVTVLVPTLQLARLGPRYRYGGLPKYLGYFDKFVLFPRQLQRHVQTARPDIVHFTDQAGAVYGSAVPGIPALATCHDLLQIRAARGEFDQQPLSGASRRHQEWILAGLTQLSHLACVSASTQADVLRLTGLPAARTSVIPNGLNHPYQRVPTAAACLALAELADAPGADPGLRDAVARGFLLHVGGDHWYKNRAGLITIFAELSDRLPSASALVLVGPPLTAGQAAHAAALGVAGRIVGVAGATNAQLEALYNLAEALIFPSWAEGFGWPIAEAQACGCPVFTSNRAPMTEVAGIHAAYFDPADPAGAARAIAGAWPGRLARRDLALAEARRWQPDLMLDAYEALYRHIIP